MADLKLDPIACEKCHGEGTIEVEVPNGRRAAEAPVTREVTCTRCDGERVEACVGCAAIPATLRGEDGRCYCGTACAHRDGNWPGCRTCEKAPQDPQHAPFCSSACTEAFLGEHAARARVG